MYIELKRFLIIKKIKNDIETYLINNYNNKINVNNLLPKWFMLQTNYTKDPLIPYNPDNFTQLKKDFYNLYKIVYTPELNYKLDLKNKCNNAILEIQNTTNNEIEEFKKTVKYEKQIDNNYIYFTIYIYKNISNDLKNDYEIENFTKFRISVKCYDKMKTKYNNENNENNLIFDELILTILLRYNALYLDNQQLAVYPKFYEFINKEFGFNIELFASSINSNYNNFCSLYPDIDKHFGALSNFNDYTLTGGFYVANPPFDETIMQNMSIKFINSLKLEKYPITILSIIPVWDEDPKYGKYMALELLKNTKYVQFIKKLEKKDSIFYDYYNDKYIKPCKIYIILLQNNTAIQKHNIIKYSLLKYINIYFINNNILYGGGLDNNYENNNENNDNDLDLNLGLNLSLKYIHLELYHNKKYKIKQNIILKKNPPKYIINPPCINMKNRVHFSTKELIYNNIDSMEEFLQDIIEAKIIKNMALIDLTEPDKRVKYIYDRLRWNFNSLFKQFLRFNHIYSIDIKYILNNNLNDINNINNINNIKYDFIFISGNKNYNYIEKAKYFAEQFNHNIHMQQIIYLLKIQQIGGSFIFLFTTANTDLYHKLITLLQMYYKKIILFKNLQMLTTLTYVIGINFLGISNTDLNILNKIYNNLIILDNKEQNIFDSKIRNKYNITIDINSNQTDIFLHNIFDINQSKNSCCGDNHTKINKFTKDIYSNIAKYC